jgi:small subunit ribosomal protein S9
MADEHEAQQPEESQEPTNATAGDPEGAAGDAEGAAAPESAAQELASTAESEAESASQAQDAAGAEAQAQPATEDQPEPQVEQADEREEAGRRVKPEVPGAHLEVDIVPEGVDPLGREETEDPYALEIEAEVEVEEEPEGATEEEDQELPQPIVTAAIDLAASARYSATGKRKTAVARVILRPGGGEYTINGRPLDNYFPRVTLQRNIRQPLEAVGFEDRMDVHARLHGGGVASQAGALRHGISRALLEADPNLRGELKRRGFLTRDSRVKERKKAGLKKARKRPQFSKR